MERERNEANTFGDIVLCFELPANVNTLVVALGALSELALLVPSPSSEAAAFRSAALPLRVDSVPRSSGFYSISFLFVVLAGRFVLCLRAAAEPPDEVELT